MSWNTGGGEHFIASNPATGKNGLALEKGGLYFSPVGYGGVGNGVALDDTPFANMIAASMPSGGGDSSSAGHYYINAGYEFLLSAPFVPPSGSRVEGGGTNAIIRNNTTDVMQISANGTYQVEDLYLYSGAGGGHCLSITGTVNYGSAFANIRMVQANAAKSCLNATQLIGVPFLNIMLDHYGVARSVPIMNCVNTAGSMNDNRFDNFILRDNFTGATAYQAVIQGGASVAGNNSLRNFIHEQPWGGALSLVSTWNTGIDEISIWDLAGTATTADMISITNNPTTTRGIFVRRYFRSAGTLGGGKFDLNSAGQQIFLSNWAFESGGTAISINFGNILSFVDRMAKGVVVTGSFWLNTQVVGAGAGAGATMSADPTGSGGNTPYIGGYRVTTAGTPAAGLLGSVRVNALANVTPTSARVAPMNQLAANAGLYVSAITLNASYTQIDISAANIPAVGNCDFEVAVNPGVALGSAN